MENTGYVTLARQSSLMREMEIIAHNIANAATTGFRQQGVVFSEYVQASGDGHSVSMASARAKVTETAQGVLTQTGNPLDLAIEGQGYFQIETSEGARLTRAGAFHVNSIGDVVSPDGYRLLDTGGAPINIPNGATNIEVAADGTVSAGGRLVGEIGVVDVDAGADLHRESGALFRTNAPVTPSFDARILQGHLEGSNVNPVLQLARMIEVQRAYETGQKLMDLDNDRSKMIAQTLIK